MSRSCRRWLLRGVLAAAGCGTALWFATRQVRATGTGEFYQGTADVAVISIVNTAAGVQSSVFVGTTDPSAGGGLSADPSSLYFKTDTYAVYWKSGAAATAWTQIGAGGGGAHDLLSATHTDTTAAAVSRGSIVVGDATPKWVEHVLGAAGTILRSNGTDLLDSTSTFADTYAAGDLLHASAANTITGLADVAAGSFLRSAGVGVAPAYSTTTWPNSATQGDILAASGANAYGNITAVAVGQHLQSAGVGTLPVWATGFRLDGYVTKGANYTTTADDYVINCTSGTFTLTLVAAATAGEGRWLFILNSGTGVITVDGNGAETISGETTQLISGQYEFMALVSDGANWFIIG